MKKEWKELNLIDYLNGTLDDEQRQQVEVAQEEDHQLRSELSLMRREIDMMRSAAEDPHWETRLSGVHDAVMREVRNHPRGSARRSSAWRSYMRAVGVMLMMVVVLALFFILRPASQSDAARLANDSAQEAVHRSPESLGKPVTIQLTSSNPKIKIFWTVYPEESD